MGEVNGLTRVDRSFWARLGNVGYGLLSLLGCFCALEWLPSRERCLASMASAVIWRSAKLLNSARWLIVGLIVCRLSRWRCCVFATGLELSAFMEGFFIRVSKAVG